MHLVDIDAPRELTLAQSARRLASDHAAYEVPRARSDDQVRQY
ncbi:MAG: hypothetical protein ACLQBX_04965 [Candidatus Limnocylindrales bacterium]